MSRRYLTPPDNLSPSPVVRRLRIPSHYAPLVSGALLSLTESWSWEQWGTDTPEQAAVKMLAMYEEWLDDMSDIGTAVIYFTENPPTGVLPCDGAIYQRADYPVLYDAIELSLVVDADRFRVPDMRGRAVVGTGQGLGLTLRNFGDTFGEEMHTLTVDEMPSHTHGEQDPGAILITPGPGPDYALADPGLPSQTGSSGGDQPHNNMQPSAAYHIGIRAW